MRFPIDSPFRGPVKDSPLWKVLTSGVFAGSLLFLISAGLDATPVAAQRINPRTAQENPTQDPNWLTSPTTSVTEVITPGQEIVIPLELSNSTTQIQAYETTLKPGEICLAGSKRSGEVSALADTSIPMTVMPDCLQSGAHHYELEIQNPMGSGRITIPIDIQVGDVITRITFDPTQISETVPYRDDTRFSVILNNPTATNQPFTGELESVGTSANCITGLPEDDVLLSGQSLEYILTVQKECLPEGTNTLTYTVTSKDGQFTAALPLLLEVIRNSPNWLEMTTDVSLTVQLTDTGYLDLVISNPTAKKEQFVGILSSETSSDPSCITGLPAKEGLRPSELLNIQALVKKACLPPGKHTFLYTITEPATSIGQMPKTEEMSITVIVSPDGTTIFLPLIAN